MPSPILDPAAIQARVTRGAALLERGQCRATIYKRDTYRYSGRGPGGFTMHYTRSRCSRVARGNGYCWQHEQQETEGRALIAGRREAQG